MRRDEERARVLDYWHSVEMFTPQAVPKVDPVDGVHNGTNRNGAWPWMPGHDATKSGLKPHQTWRHQVFCGVYDIERVNHHLAEVFHAAREASEQRPPGKSAVASFVVDADGFAVPGTLTVSTCAWAVGRADIPGPRVADWLSGFDVERVALEELFLEYAGARPAPAVDESDEELQPGQESSTPAPPPGRYLDSEAMGELLGILTDRLGVADCLAPAGFRVRTRRVRRDGDGQPDDDFLNSFYLDGLVRVREAVTEGRAGSALLSYLAPPDAEAMDRRTDVCEELDAVAARLAPDTLPAGRWPECSRMPLAASQQFAVSTAMRELAGVEGIFAVNGPPGTGKTTMLRDLVAAVVTERAVHLAALSRPEDAFTGQKHRFAGQVYPRTVHTLRPELVGHEIVVASSNNGAVENISREIPGTDAVKRWPDPPPYFTELAQLVLDGQRAVSKNARQTTAWGLLAAPLGKSANRTILRNALMFGSSHDGNVTTPVIGLHDRLKQWEAGGERPSWTEARRSFRKAHERVELLRARRSAHGRMADELARAVTSFAETDRALLESRAAVRRATEAGAAAAEHLRRARAVAEPLTAAWQARLQLRPGRFADVVSFGRKGRRWQQESRPLADHVERVGREVAAAVQAEGRTVAQLTAAHAREQQAAAAWGALTAQVTRLRAAMAPLVSTLGEHSPAGWASRSVRERELGAPWLDDEFSEARTRLFLAALHLHEAWIANAGYRFRQNFLAATDALVGQIPRRGHEEALRGAWQTLFLIVPVVSTTFASVDRMFAGLGREDLGWLVVDEAGQATPQAAVGAMWRTRRSVIVGDPLQLKPVVTLGEVPQELLRDHHGVHPRWVPSRSSLQTLADQLCRYGTYLPGDDGGPARWVGAPLRVHRRCLDPMFRISNEMVYHGLMISDTPEDKRPGLFESAWCDVAGPAEDHWRPEQGEAAIGMLQRLVEVQELLPDDIIVISPFHGVADRLGAMIRRVPTLRGVRAGTVHTAQGKEAEVVLLVLGGNPRAPRAKSFATGEPNLLNVAVTRAKSRLYVVGERSDWIELPHFRHLSELPVRDAVRRRDG